MAQNYTVNYNINVKSKAAVNALTAMESSVAALTRAPEQLQAVADKINGLSKTFSKLSKTYKLGFETKDANTKLDRIIRKLRTINDLAAKSRTITIREGKGSSRSGSSSSSSGKGGGATGVVATGGSKNGLSKQTAKPQGSRSMYRGSNNMPKRGNYAYKTLGPSMIDSGGIGAIDMLKGMGIMYGITGLGSLMSNVIRDSAQYDNVIQTTKNILQSHDLRDNFGQRFAGMESTIRSVGLATKYTAPEVADASKFLAMAGFKVEDIQQAIRPVADIALIGDTDLGSTADMVTNIMTGYEMKSNQIRNAADIMTMTFTSANTSLTQLAEAYKYSASILNSGGVNFETATAALGVLGNAGLQGSHGGTTMRMIMNNLANPTKKQQKEWSRLGINTTDINGRIRPINEIFSELGRKGVGLEEMTRLFRITAAPGATVLAQNADEWNRIIKANYASNGLSDKLALEKQNTIQGLWAQITSQLTENGLQSFESMQSQIRGFMLEILNWLRGGEAKKYMAEFGQMVMNLVKMFKDFSLTLLETYHRFQPLIELWLQVQLKLSAILIPLRIFRSLMNFGGLLITATANIGKYSVALGGLLRSMRSLSSFRGQWERTKMSIMHGWGLMNLGHIPNGGFKSFTTATGKIHRNVDKNTMLRYQGMVHRNQKAAAFMNGTAGVLGGTGALLGGLLGSQFGEVGSAGNIAATIGGSLLGGSLIGALGSVPLVGWATAAAAALGYLSIKAYENWQAAQKGQEAWQGFINATKVENGVLTGEGLTATQRYYELAYNHALNLTQITQKRVDLLNEELRLQNGGVKEDEGRLVDRQKLDQILGFATDSDSWFGSTGMAKTAASQINQLSNGMVRYLNYGGYELEPGSGSGNWKWRDASGRYQNINNPWGTNDSNDALAAMTALYMEGYQGTEGQKIRDEFQNKLRSLLMTNGSLEDIMAVKNEFDSRFSISNYLSKSASDTFPSSFAYGYNDVQDGSVWNGQKIAASYPYRQGVYNMMAPTFGTNAEVWRAAENYHTNLAANTLVENQVVDFMRFMDVTFNQVMAAYKSNTESDVNAWVKSLGFENGKFNLNNEQLQLLQRNLQNILTTLNLLPLPAQQAASNLFTLVNNLNTVAQSQIWYNSQSGVTKDAVDGGTGAKAGDTRNTSAGTYLFDGKEWQLQGAAANLVTALTLPDTTMAQILKSEDNSKKAINFGGDGDSITNPTKTTPNPGPNASDYKNHYRSQNAAPKQVIVRIGNLMNVQSIDMSKKDNSEVINDFKSQMAQALIDVVHDFDESYYG